MTDDKGAGEGPYTIGSENGQDCIVGPGFNIPGARITQSGNPWGTRLLQLDMNLAYAAGRKAERERCAKIVADHDHECGMIDRDSVLEKIRGGQDGK